MNKFLKEHYGKASLIGFVVLFYFFLPVEFRPVLQYAYAQENKERDCKIAKIEWNEAYHQWADATDRLEKDPNNGTYKNAVATYKQALDQASSDKVENC
tara:strand:+ start:626 stop:922 length:297 start_codon:yes stop_codon:yes gene_type:complete